MKKLLIISFISWTGFIWFFSAIVYIKAERQKSETKSNPWTNVAVNKTLKMVNKKQFSTWTYKIDAKDFHANVLVFSMEKRNASYHLLKNGDVEKIYFAEGINKKLKFNDLDYTMYYKVYHQGDLIPIE